MQNNKTLTPTPDGRKLNCCLTYNTGDLALPLGELARRKA